MNKPQYTPPTDVKSVLQLLKRPKTAIVTGGMPYANGPLHLGHLAGAIIPPDIMARYMRMLIGKQIVLFVSGNDDHGGHDRAPAEWAAGWPRAPTMPRQWARSRPDGARTDLRNQAA